MSDYPFKLRALRALTDAMKAITPANGFVSDMADFDPGDGHPMARVYRGRAWFGDSDPIPMISILEGTDPTGELAEMPASAASGEYDWPILIQGWVDDDPLNPTDPAYVLLADVRRRLAELKIRKVAGTHQPDPLGLGIAGPNKILRLDFGPGVVRPADEISSKAWFWLTVTLRVVEKADVPYS